MPWDPYVTSLPVSRARPPVPWLCPSLGPGFSLNGRRLLLTSLFAPSRTFWPFGCPITTPRVHCSSPREPSLLLVLVAAWPSFEGWSLCWGPPKPTPTWPSPSSDGHTAAQGQGGSTNLWVLLPQVTHPTTACADLPSGSFLCPKCSRPSRVGAVGTRDSQPHQAP